MEENNIKSFDDKMTIFYSKTTGKIVATSTGIQSMDFFGENKEDYEKIYAFIVTEKDDFVLNNSINFKIENEQIKSIIDLSKYS